MKLFACLTGSMLLCSSFSFAQQAETFSGAYQDIVAPKAQLELLSDGFAFTEGPAVDREGNVYFTDQPNNKIWKYDVHGKLSVFMENAGRSNGLYVDPQNNLIACADEHNQLWRIQENKVTKLVEHYQDTLLNGPNDVWVAPNGFIYITDPYYQRDYWTRQAPDMRVAALYLYKPDGELIRLDENFKQPNGLIGSADGKCLYVADIGDNKTYRYTIQDDGTLANRMLFIPQGSDGMTIDASGNLYLTGDGISVYDRNGRAKAHIAVPAKWTANVCFGAQERNLLFITASDKVFTLRMSVKGVK